MEGQLEELVIKLKLSTNINININKQIITFEHYISTRSISREPELFLNFYCDDI